jgi:glycerol uptake facilitator-like aquaporin
VPVAVGVWIGGAYWFTSSTSLANPAVSIARSFTESFAGIARESVPMFIVMQITGLVIATLILSAFIKRQHFQ